MESPLVHWVQPTNDVFHFWEGVDIWVMNRTDFSKKEIASLWEKLSFREKEKALRFHFERDRIRYVLTHGVLRNLIGRYLKIEIDTISFRENKSGKPFLDLPFFAKEKNIEFNISHSGNMILIGFRFSKNKNQIGIDVEKIKSDFDFELVLDSFFTEKEKENIWTSENSSETFFKYWTRKEALVKATGTGLNHELKWIDLSKEINLLKTEEAKFSEFLAKKMFIHTFKINKNYVASIALTNENESLRFLKYKNH